MQLLGCSSWLLGGFLLFKNASDLPLVLSPFFNISLWNLIVLHVNRNVIIMVIIIINVSNMFLLCILLCGVVKWLFRFMYNRYWLSESLNLTSWAVWICVSWKSCSNSWINRKITSSRAVSHDFLIESASRSGFLPVPSRPGVTGGIATSFKNRCFLSPLNHGVCIARALPRRASHWTLAHLCRWCIIQKSWDPVERLQRLDVEAFWCHCTKTITFDWGSVGARICWTHCFRNEETVSPRTHEYEAALVHACIYLDIRNTDESCQLLNEAGIFN